MKLPTLSGRSKVHQWHRLIEQSCSRQEQQRKYTTLNKISSIFCLLTALATHKVLLPRGCSESCDKLQALLLGSRHCLVGFHMI